MALAIGSPAPDFTLKSKNADGLLDVRLSDNFGKRQTVLLFFPFAFTGVCTKEMCDVTGGLDDYAKVDAAVYGISVDSPHAQFAWSQQERIGVALLSDLNKEVTRAYDVAIDGPVGTFSARAAFVIGKDGVIKHSERTPTPKDLPDFNAIKAALAAP
ncbi:MAG TPA: redoxin domain-containing protein [Opitutaceae bacterium]|nr:redoxin domain-containing protein [Opitutaceae bacterium]